MSRKTLTLGFQDHLTEVEVDLPEGEPRPWDADTTLTQVGKPVPRIDGHLKVSGRAQYTFDVAVPGMLHAAVLRCPLPCARITKLSLAGAEKAPGVKAALAVASKGDRLIFAGQDVAAVAATRPELAHDALAAIEVEYEPLPFVVDLVAASKAGAPAVHQGKVRERRTEGDEPGAAGEAGGEGNVRPMPSSKRGDARKALGKAAVVHRATYTTSVQTHSALETHGILVRWDAKDRITAWCSTQGIFSVRDELAEIFELPSDHVTVITEFLGGGFGAKFGASAPGTRMGFIAGELARKAGAPVKLMCDRHEEHVCTGNRPDSRQEIELGADKAGKLVAIAVKSLGTAGIGTGAGIGRNAFSIYTRVPHVSVEASDVFTNAGPATAMRAPGHPQGAFALELAIDELAAKAQLDALRLRIDHDEHPVRRWQFEEGAKRFGWAQARARSAAQRGGNARMRTGVGVAASIWGDFGRGGAAQVTCRIGRDGSVAIENGVQDIGGGIGTVMAQVAAEVLRRPLDGITMKIGRSDFGPSVGSGGSVTTSSVAPAVRNAAERARAQLTDVAAELFGVKPQEVTWRDDGTIAGGGKSLTFAQLCKKMPAEAIVATATRAKTFGSHPMAFPGTAGPQAMPQIAGVQFAEVEVDTWTGVVRAKRVLAMHDCGRVMNALTTRSQVQGGIILGTSYGLLEERVLDRDFGRMLNPNLEQYKIAGARDIPDIEVVLTDVFVGNNSTGAIGIGEPATIPTAAAIGCAVFDALGVPVRSLPITPAKVLAALGVVPA
ncbi:MAG: xanthine dehydrogenase family protein molybdopterin-binding subunit [Deltaproteobacteria bacterium]|nr:xanthine dehydrogenase family protein molybdopterin-binding subunit [Deltaproteobacteria bacterium]MBK8241158.1 xanthine dehydrogenase family protein molybdopterin-binding subunit [Deltaproteobacteria bacterium]MBK8716918.1 xanthine dehydrogenase family protein molybdopterin-binding subunit [Deltaproteobacteria bacterium]MBP7287022.1 xanthine dehydrogenase family protein molybdopterin-binding subunit [Nannocystaceae bacterium]